MNGSRIENGKHLILIIFNLCGDPKLSNENVNDKQDIGSVRVAKESHEKAKLGKPSKFLKVQKSLLYIFAILAAGLIELIIIIIFSLL